MKERLTIFIVWFLLIIAMFLLSNCAAIDFTPRPWTKGEKVAGAAFVVAHTANWYSTKRHQSFDNITEMNPILGERPSQEQIAGYFLLSGLAGLGIAHIMPEYRYWILAPYTATNFYFTYHDMRLMRNMKAAGVN